MFPDMAPRNFFSSLPTRIRRTLRSIMGAFDLPSIITGVVVVGILATGVLAGIFGVIPFSQDHGARQELSSVRTAEGVAKAKDGKYLASGALTAAGYLSGNPTAAVGTDASGSCWVGIIKSESGAAFYATTAKKEPAPYAAGTDTGCLTLTEQGTLAGSAGMPVIVAAGYGSSWGENTYGQLGNNSFTQSSVPVTVLATGALAGKAVTAVTAGPNHSCAVADGAAYCWGQNTYGQLGNSTTVNSATPVAVDTTGALAGKQVQAVWPGAFHMCVLADGAVYCWGQNTYGQLGDNSLTNSSVPVAVNTAGILSGKTVTAGSSGGTHTCVVSDGAGYCWGQNGFGQLGINSLTDSSVPVAVSTSGVMSGKTVTAISSGSQHTCALTDGAAYCWGRNTNSQLGNNSVDNSSVPVAVTNTGVLSGKTVTVLSAGGHYTCARANGAAYCWGQNASGQLGNNSLTNSSVPVAVTSTGVLSGKTVTAISSGSHHTCAVADGATYCWGYNGSGQLGNNSVTNSSVPVTVINTGVLSGKTVIAVSSGGYYTTAFYK